MKHTTIYLLTAILFGSATSSRAADRLTYAFGGPEHRPVDTIAYADPKPETEQSAPKVLDLNRRPVLFGERVWPESAATASGAIVEIRSKRPFLQEPPPDNSPLLRGQSPFEVLRNEGTWHVPAHYTPGMSRQEEPAETLSGSLFDGMLIAS